jgi:hypothetical protein
MDLGARSSGRTTICVSRRAAPLTREKPQGQHVFVRTSRCEASLQLGSGAEAPGSTVVVVRA